MYMAMGFLGVLGFCQGFPKLRVLFVGGRCSKEYGTWSLHCLLLVAETALYKYMSSSLNSLKGGYIGDDIGDYYRGY